MGEPYPGRWLVTGGRGFLGAAVVACARASGVTDIVAPGRDEADLTRQVEAEALLARTRPETVVHLAARVGGIEANRRNPGLFFYANATMGIHVVEACRQQGVRKLVVVGTTCAYPRLTPLPFREDDLWNGYPEATNAPYGVAKRALLTMVRAYREQYGLDGIYLLPANLYGPRDNFDLESGHVIPGLIRRFMEARDAAQPAVRLWGTGQPTREFLYVGDCADAVVRAARLYSGADPVNIGTGREIRIADLAALIAGLVGYGGELRWDPARPDGQPRRRLDVTRASHLFGFSATTPLEAGLRETIAWYAAARKAGPPEQQARGA